MVALALHKLARPETLQAPLRLKETMVETALQMLPPTLLAVVVEQAQLEPMQPIQTPVTVAQEPPHPYLAVL